MSKKYLSLEEAANLLSIPVHELQRLRERGEVRGFADRGNWKFKQEDIENLARSLQADSNPDVPMIPEDNDATAMFDLDAGEGDSSDDVGEQPTVIRKDGSLSDDNLLLDEEGGKDPLADSDSDVRLVGGPEVEIDLDSDSDVKLAGVDEIPGESGNDGTLPEFQMEGMNSDSDVRLLGPDSDSNINLDSADSDSDVQLVGNDSASDVQLIADDGRGPADDESTEMPLVSGASDVSLLSDDEQAMAIDFDDEGDSPGSGSVLSDESGISLGGDSSLLLGGESGISLEGPADSGIALDADGDEGITLAMDDDSGISLDAGDSGISLESIGDSGISLESDEQSGTIPMMDISDGDEPPETQFEIPSLQDDDESSYELQDDGDTGVFEVAGSLDDTGENELDDAVFDLDEGEDAYGGMDDAFDTDDGDFEDDAFAADDDLDVFNADDDMFGDVDEEESFVGGGGGMAMSQQEWGAGTFAGLTIATLCLLLCGAVMIDLVKNTATAAQPNPISGMVLDMLGGLYKG